MSNTASRACLSCKGSGLHHHEAFTSGTESFPAKDYRCNACGGTGVFAAIAVPAILEAIRGRKGLCSRRPEGARAYYVWRMARFHGGIDVTMPVVATMLSCGDPFRAEMDIMADAVAKRVYGTNLAGAHRWGMALEGLPETAYSSGPVLAGEKPDLELAELAL